jgi:predicted transcriptional regulator
MNGKKKVQIYELLYRISNGMVNQTQIAKELGVSKQAVNKRIKRLINSSLIAVKSNGSFELTDKGRFYLNSVSNILQHVPDIESYLAHFDVAIESLLNMGKSKVEGMNEYKLHEVLWTKCGALQTFLMWIIAIAFELMLGIEKVDDVEKVRKYIERRLNRIWHNQLKPLLLRIALLMLTLEEKEWKLLRFTFFNLYHYISKLMPTFC